VQQVVCIITKMDTCDWAEERYRYIVDTLMPFLKNSCGLDCREFIPIDGYSGNNMVAPIDRKLCDWYEGRTLFECFDGLPTPKRDPMGPIRIPILDQLKDNG